MRALLYSATLTYFITDFIDLSSTHFQSGHFVEELEQQEESERCLLSDVQSQSFQKSRLRRFESKLSEKSRFRFQRFSQSVESEIFSGRFSYRFRLHHWLVNSNYYLLIKKYYKVLIYLPVYVA